MRCLAALPILILLASCAAQEADGAADDLRTGEIARADVAAIVEGMMRAREDRLRREVRRMIRQDLGRPPG